MDIITTINKTDYNLKLNLRGIITLEKKMNKGTLQLLTEFEAGKMPTVEEMLIIFECSLFKNHPTITGEQAEALFEQYLVEHSITDFIMLIVDIFKASGIIPTEENETEKN